MAELINMPRAAWKQQPTGVVRLNTYNALTQELAFLVNLASDMEIANATRLLITGTTPHLASNGRSLGFGVSGLGANDNVYTSIKKPLAQKSIFVIACRISSGGGGLGRLISGAGFSIYNNNASYIIDTYFSGNNQSDYTCLLYTSPSPRDS